MSYNQSRPGRSDTHYRKTGRPAGFNQHRTPSASYGKGPGAGLAPSPSISSPSLSCNRSIKKSNTVQGGQSRVNPPSVNSSVSNNVSSPRSLQNDAHVRPQFQDASDAPVVSGSSNSTEYSSSQRNNRAVPKPPTAQSTTVISDNNEPQTPSKASGDASKVFAFQFGSLSPGFMNGMQIPARTSSAPPNLDEQKSDQALHDSLRSVPNLPMPVPKQQVTNRDVDQSTDKEKRDAQIPSAHPANQAQKSPAAPVRMTSMQTPYQPPQVSSVQFGGGPNLHIQSQNVTASSLQMPMPMPIPMANAPQMQQQLFVPGLQSHPMPHHGIMLQAQGLSFTTPMGMQLPPQLSHMGMGVSSRYPQKQGGKFGTTVKITHPDTHEELRLDKRADSGSSGRSQPDIPPQSQPVPSFASSLPFNYFHGSYNTGSVVFPPSSLPLTSSQMTPNSQATRFSYPIRSGSSAHSVVDSSHLGNARDLQNAISSPPSGTTKVTIKPATVIGKAESPKSLRPSGEISTPLSQKNMESGLESSLQELKPDNSPVVSKTLPKEMKPIAVASDTLSVAAAASSEENMPAVTLTGTNKGETIRSDSIKDHQNKQGREVHTHLLPEVIGHSTVGSQISDLAVSISYQTAEMVDVKAIPSPLSCGHFKEPPVESLSGVDNVSESKADRIVQGSTQISSEISGNPLQGEGIKCNTQGIELGSGKRLSEEHMEGGKCEKISSGHHVSVDEKLIDHVEQGSILKMEKINNRDPNIGTELGEVDDATNVCPGTERMANIMDTPPAGVSNSTDLQSSNVPPDLSETTSINEGADGAGNLPSTVSKDKSLLESNMARSFTSRSKKKMKEILQKADAAGMTSDLYMAYKAPEEKKEMAMPSESTEGVYAFTNTKPATANGVGPKTVATKEVEQSRAELEDWEDAADASTPKLKTPHDAENGQGGSSHDLKDDYGYVEKKYSRDFLLKFADECSCLPEGFEILSDIADALMSPNLGATDQNSYSSPARVVDRQRSGTRIDCRGSNMMVDDRWIKSPGSFGSGRDPRLDSGYAGNVGFRPGQGGNSGVLRNPHAQAPIVSRVLHPMGPLGGMGRNSANVEKWQRATNYLQKGLIPSPQTPLQMMHRAERKYEVGKVTDEEEAKQRRLKAILNKLTPQNFEKLIEQVKEVDIDNADTLKGVISQIFDKALMEPTFCEMYADLCFHLSQKLPDFTENNEKITFKRSLLNKCQEEFERGEKEEEEANQVREGEAKQTEGEREEKRLKARRRMLGNIRLIGELYRKKMLTEKIMHECINNLLGYYQDPDEENIEALCKLMSTIGEMIDHPRAKVHMDTYFERMVVLSNNTKLSSRVRFMLRDAIDLRKNKWQLRRKVEGPKKIDEVHRDAAQERQTQASRLARGPSINLSARRGPGDFGPRGGSLLSSPNLQMGKFRGLPQARGFGTQDMKLDDRMPFEAGTWSVRLPQRSSGDDSISLVPQGGLGTGMSIRGPPVATSTPVSDISRAGGDSRRMAAGFNGFGPDRFPAPATYGASSTQGQGINYGKEDHRNSDHSSDSSFGASPAIRQHGLSSVQNVPSGKVCSEERLRDMSMSAIKEFYSARDKKEIGMCIKDINSPSFHPTMISLWVTDSFDRKDVDRDLLAKLLVNLVKSPDSILSQAQLTKGFEFVLTALEDAVNDAPKAAEYLGRIFGEVIIEKVVSLEEIGRLIREGGEETGSLVEFGLAGDVLGSALEMVKSKAGESVLNSILQSSGLRLEDFKPPEPNRSMTLENFM